MKTVKILVILLVCVTAGMIAQVSSACGTYSVSPPTSSPAGTEYHLYCNKFQFGSFIIDNAGNNLIFRPRPDQLDVNGWGTSWFMAPFLPGSVPTSGSGYVNSITAGSDGIHASLSGVVANGAGSNYGIWNIIGTLAYNNLAEKITASGNLNLSLSGTLTAANGDLNLERLSSNYLYNVPLQSGGLGDTGDMKQAIATYGTPSPHTLVWVPPQQPNNYPTDTSTSLGIEVVGQINNVDTLVQGKGFQIAIAYKPSISVEFNSTTVPLNAGFAWDSSKGQDFAADNIGINHLVLKQNSNATNMSFNFNMEAHVEQPHYGLVLTKNGAGIGSVVSSPEGINCGSSCTATFINKTMVTLTPQANSGSYFTGWSGACNGKGSTCQVTVDQVKSVTASFGTIRTDSLVIDFNPYGLWLRNSNGNWGQLHSLPTRQLVPADLDGNGIFDLVVDFNPYGLWNWMNRQSWVYLHSLSPTVITAADVLGNGNMDLAIDFAPNGLWMWMNNLNWANLHYLPSKSITAAYLDDNNQKDLVIDLAPYGLWQRMNNQDWLMLDSTRSPTANIAADLDGNGHDDLIFSLGPSNGLWVYMNHQNWVQLHSLSPATLVAADLDGNGQGDLVIDFAPYGIFIWMNNQNWVKLHDLPASAMASANLDGNPQQDLVIDFAPYGIWIFMNNQTWVQLHSLPSKHIVALPE